VLDPAPRPVSDTVSIDIPSEKTPFTPRLALPPVPEPGSAPMAPPDVAPAQEGKGEAPAKGDEKNEGKADPRAASADDKNAPTRSDAKAEAKPEAKVDVKADPKANAQTDAKADARTAAEAQRARDRLEGKTSVDKKGRFTVQAAALGSETAANDLSARLNKAGLAPYTERVQTPEGPRWRVRLGPYATRDEAEKVRARLRAMDVNATLISG
jgi:DedD protein